LTNLQNPGTDSGGCRNEDITCNIITSYFEHKVDASYTTVQKFGDGKINVYKKGCNHLIKNI